MADMEKSKMKNPFKKYEITNALYEDGRMYHIGKEVWVNPFKEVANKIFKVSIIEYKRWRHDLVIWEEKRIVFGKVSYYVYSVFKNGKTKSVKTFFKK
jgi:hypothetical protein